MDMAVRSGELDRADRSGGAARPSLLLILSFLLVAFAPAIFALCTWNTGLPEGRGFLESQVRYFGLPILGAELFVVIVAMAAGFAPARTVRAMPRWVQAALLSLVVIAFGTALLAAPQPILAMLRTCMSALHLLFGLAAAWLIGAYHPALRTSFWPMIVAGLAAYALILCAFVASIADWRAFDWFYFGLGMIHIRQVGFYSAVGAAAALGLAAIRPGARNYLLWVGAAALLLALSFWSGTRGSLIAVLGAFGAGLLVLPGLRTMRACSALIAANAAGAALSLIPASPHPLFGLWRIFSNYDGLDEASSGRIAMWLDTLRAIGERPWFGYGEGQFRLVVSQSQGVYNHPHNSLLQIALQWGGVGLACALAIAGSIAWRICSVARRDPELTPALLVAAALAVFSLYEGTLFHPYPIMMLALAIAFLLGRPVSPASPPPPGAPASARG